VGTRADYYIGRGPDAIWLGSIAWDGDPHTHEPLLAATTKDEFLEAVREHCRGRDDFTSPDDGWPWPWTDSHTSDYAYTFDDGTVWLTQHEPGPYTGKMVWCSVACYNEHAAVRAAWWKRERERDSREGTPQAEYAADPEPEALVPDGGMCVFPDMTDVQNVQLGRKSGIILIGY
jgi:hypothetical protein